MAQNKIELQDLIQRERLSSKEMKSILKSKHSILDEDFSKVYLNKTYILDDKKVIVSFQSHGYLYNSLEDLKIWIDTLSKKSKIPTHILKNRLLYNEDFKNHTKDLIDTLKNILQLNELFPSIEGLKIIDKYINAKKLVLVDTKLLFNGMVAYTGEVFKTVLPNAEWKMIRSTSGIDIWEPYIYSNGKKFNPFFLVYKEMYEELTEIGKFSLSDAVKTELNK